MHTPVHTGSAGVVRELLAKGAHAGARSDRGFTPLLLAAKNGHLEVGTVTESSCAYLEAKSELFALDIGSVSTCCIP